MMYYCILWQFKTCKSNYSSDSRKADGHLLPTDLSCREPPADDTSPCGSSPSLSAASPASGGGKMARSWPVVNKLQQLFNLTNLLLNIGCYIQQNSGMVFVSTHSSGRSESSVLEKGSIRAIGVLLQLYEIRSAMGTTN